MQRKIEKFGFGKQTAKGSPLANPTYGFGLKSGRVFTLDLAQEVDDLTAASGRFAPQGVRTRAVPGSAFNTRVWPKSIPLAAYAALGAIATAGVNPYTHTITPADTVPYLSVFGRLAAEYARVQDAFLNELTFSWEGAAPLDVEASFLGTDALFGTAWTPTTDEEANAFFRPVGGTFKVDAASGTPATAAIAGGSVRFANNVGTVDLSDSVLPDDVSVGAQLCDVRLTLIPANLQEFKKAIGGASGATAIAETPTYGSFEVKFLEGTKELKIAATRVMFACEWPEGDPAGGRVELELVGSVVKPTDASAAVTVTVINDVATY